MVSEESMASDMFRIDMLIFNVFVVERTIWSRNKLGGVSIAKRFLQKRQCLHVSDCQKDGQNHCPDFLLKFLLFL